VIEKNVQTVWRPLDVPGWIEARGYPDERINDTRRKVHYKHSRYDAYAIHNSAESYLVALR
jgi:hypothetical protein